VILIITATTTIETITIITVTKLLLLLYHCYSTIINYECYCHIFTIILTFVTNKLIKRLEMWAN